MKKLTTLLLSTLSIAMVSVSCTKEDKPTTSANSIEGTWQFDKKSTVIPDIPSDEQDINDPSCQYKNYYTFKSGGVLEEGYVKSCNLQKLSGDWKKTGDILEVNSSDGTKMKYTIASITETKLTLKYYFAQNSTDIYSQYTLIRK